MSLHFRQQGQLLVILGQTYAHRERIKAIGGRYHGPDKVWRLPLTPENLAKVEGLCAALGGGSLTSVVIGAEVPTADEGERPIGLPITLPQEDGSVPPAEPGSPDDLSVRQLMEQIHGAIAGAFPRSLWLVGEVQSLAKRASGVFFELADRVEGAHDNATTTVRAILWSGIHAALEGRLGADALAEILRDGQKIRCQVKVQFYRDRASISLAVQDVDPAFTQGALALARAKLLRELRQKGLDQANKRLTISPFPLRLGLISAEGSRAVSDFLDQLRERRYPGEVYFCPAAMQGEGTVTTVVAAMERLVRRGIDLLVITRGGGSAADLRWFDAPEIAYAIAVCPVPVIAAIGHHDDVCVAEEVCHLRQKTPTAAADVVADLCQATRERLAGLAQLLAKELGDSLSSTERQLTSLSERLGLLGLRSIEGRGSGLLSRASQLAGVAAERLARRAADLIGLGGRLDMAASAALARADSTLASLDARLGRADPQPWLAQGWTQLSTLDDPPERVVHAQSLQPGTRLSARLRDGWLRLLVEATSPAPNQQSDPAKERP